MEYCKTGSFAIDMLYISKDRMGFFCNSERFFNFQLYWLAHSIQYESFWVINIQALLLYSDNL